MPIWRTRAELILPLQSARVRCADVDSELGCLSTQFNRIPDSAAAVF